MDGFCIDAGLVSSLDDLDEDEVRNFAELHQDGSNDDQAELFIYALCLAFKKGGSVYDLARALDRTQEWIASISERDLNSKRQTRILDAVTDLGLQKKLDSIGSAGTENRQGTPSPIPHEVLMHLHQAHDRLWTHITTHSPENCELEDLDQAIRYLKQIISFTTEACPWGKLSNLGVELSMRFGLSKAIHDLDTAISILRRVENEGPHRTQISALLNLASCLLQKFTHCGNLVEDLDDAITMSVKGVAKLPLEKSTQLGLFRHVLTDCLAARIGLTPWINDLNSAITAMTKVMEVAAPNEIQPGQLEILGNLHGQRFLAKGEVSDIDNVICLAKQAAQLTASHQDSQYGSCMYSLGTSLLLRFEETGSLENLNDAIVALKRSLPLLEHTGNSRLNALHSLGHCLRHQYLKTESLDTLNEAIILTTNLVKEASSATEKNKAQYLSYLGEYLKWRFLRTGSGEDIIRAVDVASQAVDLIPKDHADRLRYLTDLANILRHRFSRFGSLDDISRAISFLRNEAPRVPVNHPNALEFWNLLGICHSQRYMQTEEGNELDRAIMALTMAVERSSDPSVLTRQLGNLASSLRLRFKRSHSLEDLDAAVQKATTAIESMPPDYDDKAVWHGILGACLAERYMAKKNIEDLAIATEESSKALKETRKDSPDRAIRLMNHAENLSLRYEELGREEDLQQQLASCIEGFQCSSAPPFYRIAAARLAGRAYSRKGDWKNASKMFREGVNLLPRVTLKTSRQIEAQAMLKDFGVLAPSAASAALSAGEEASDALQILELGRGVLSSMDFDAHTDISDLRKAYPDLAEQFIRIRDELKIPRNDIFGPRITTQLPMVELAETRRYQAEQEFDQLIETIRGRPSFHDFLRPPTAETLMAAAQAGPIVVVNMSPYRSDAFLIEQHSIKTIELPMLTIGELVPRIKDLHRQMNLADVLEWTWHAICNPCLDALSLTRRVDDNNWPHIWWVPTGKINQLPLHAAGLYRESSHDTVMDRVISSYALTIKGLIHGRRQRRTFSSLGEDQLDSAVLVAMENTPGMVRGHLPSAKSEIALVQGLCSDLKLHPILPQTKKSDVLDNVSKCQLFHFAGHGRYSEINPVLGRIYLDDWELNPLTVGDLRDVRLHESPPFLAYLSACSTGADRWNHVLDEGLNLVCSFYFAGFRHVIGTFWSVLDQQCVEVARIFYETLRGEGMTDGAVSLGLHRAVREVRNRDIQNLRQREGALVDDAIPPPRHDISPHWIPYFHFGV